MKLQFCDRYYNIKNIKRHDNQRILQLIFEFSMIKIAFGKIFELLSCDYKYKYNINIMRHIPKIEDNLC